jgi:hypothetical protein
VDLPIIELTLEELEQGIDATALVENPAIQRNWMAFNDQKEFRFNIHNEEKRILAGALMVADFPMYRNMNGKEFFATIKANTIEKLVDRLVLKNKLTAFNFEHDSKQELPNLHIQQMYLINPELGMNPPKGYGELSTGSCFVFVKVNNEKVWEDYVKTGRVKGFSIEGMFEAKGEFSEQQIINELEQINKIDNMSDALKKLNELTDKLKARFSSEPEPTKDEPIKDEPVKMAEATLTDGTKVMYEGELAEGTIVLLEDGTAAPDGEHTFEDGTVISIEGGQVVAVAKPMTEQEMAIQKLTEMVTKLETENAELKSNFEKSITESVAKVEEKFSAQIKESNKLTEDVLELVKTLVADETDSKQKFNTQSKPKSYIDSLANQFKYEQTKIK